MKRYISKIFAGLVLVGLALPGISFGQNADEVFRAAGSPHNPKVNIAFNRYYTAEGLAELSKKIADAHPDLVKRISIGKSYEGRDIWMLQVTNFKKGNPERKPAFYVDGNIHSNEIQGAEICIYTAWYLTENFGDVDYITEVLDDRIFYIVPTINPDARNNYMKEANTGSSPRSGMMPFDDDRDGLVDEDGLDDLDGDGSVTSMRRKSDYGDFIIDPLDPRKMIQIGPDDVTTAQRYELLGSEGIDNDGDGRVNEDRPGYYDPNRDWAWKWQPDYIQGGALKYPFSVPANRAVADFVLAHPNIAGAQSFHNSGGMILRGPGAEEDLATYNRADLRIYDAIGEKGEKMLPGYRYLTVYKDLYSVFGGELDWFYGSRGIYTFTNEIFSSFAYYKNERPDRNQSYDFDRELLANDAFTPWAPYNHPTYGEIEIGGFKKNFGRATPGFMLEEELHRNMAFALYHAHHMPKLSIDKVMEKDLGGGLREVTAIIKNERLMPTHASQDLKYKIERPDYISIDGVSVQAGMIVEDLDLGITTEQKVNPAKLEVANIPGNGTVIVRWIVSGRGTPKITVDSAKGGLITR
ncbi:M14 family metallopeptidase [Roseivirga sp. UBA1976]|uniref:M14 family metallopeptidase n=1 Tax=Roseivirga sp. UBA1976 TaxID=1947386 RepID=UPI00257D2AA9|nr:M14 family metallopeptidase [Roseivirga sp. UBA1976]MEC7753481.1 M14 family metallopeptidase [Bacteroidota bacterium]|tara:strand:+ start:899 stop:2638 length:1740 start_codon:yes stop_codon:yes gene_type:complete